jgi:hypothetical protein
MELRQFLRAASKREWAEVAVVCNDSVSYLYQLAGKHRYASALMAARIEVVTREVAARSGGRLEAVLRESLVRYPEMGFFAHPPEYALHSILEGMCKKTIWQLAAACEERNFLYFARARGERPLAYWWYDPAKK